MRRRSPRFAFRMWVLLAVSLIVPPACSGSSRNVDAPKPVASVLAVVAAAPPPRDPCEIAADLRKKVKPFLDEGRLHRTVRLIEKADRLCPKSAPETWAALVTTLAELGKYAEARKVAAQIEADANASAEAKAAASSAKDTCDKLDKVFPAEGDAKEAMKKLYKDAMVADKRTDSDSKKRAKEKYLAAWEAWRPNGQALLLAGFAAKKLGQPAEAQRLFDRAIVDGEKAQRSEVKLEVPNGLNGGVTAMAFSRNAQWLAVAHGKAISIFDVATWAEKFPLEGYASSLAFAPDNKTLASASLEVTLWDVATGRMKRTLPLESDAPIAIAYSPKGEMLATGDGTLRLWEVDAANDPRTLAVGDATSVAYSPDGKTLASGSEDGTIWLSDVVTGKEIRTLKGHAKHSVLSVAYAPDGKTLASVAADYRLQLWDVATGQKPITLTGDENAYTDSGLVVAYSPDGKTLAFRGRLLELWDVTTRKQIKTWDAGAAVAYSPDSKKLALWHLGAVKLWDIEKGTEEAIPALKQHALRVTSVAYSPDGKTLASASEDGKVRLWEVATAKDPRTNAGGGSFLAFSPDTNSLASRASDDTVKLWDVATGKETRTLTGTGYALSVAYSRDGKTLAWGTYEGTVKLWDVTTGTQLLTLEGHAALAGAVAYSPDGKTLASGSDDKTVKLWDVATGKELRTLTGHTEQVFSVAYSPDSKTLASGSVDQTVKLWDVATGKELRTLPRHAGRVWSVAYAPDGKTLASGSASFSDNGTVKLWDVATGKEVRTIAGADEFAFSPDGKTLALSGDDGSIRIHRVDDGVELVAFRALAEKNAHYAFTPSGHIDFRGPDACSVRQYPICRIGALVFPFEVCEERFYAPSLLAKVQSGDTSYLEPENAPTLMDCP